MMLRSAIRTWPKVRISWTTQNVFVSSTSLQSSNIRPQVGRYYAMQLIRIATVANGNCSRTLASTTNATSDEATNATDTTATLHDNAVYERVCGETLDALCDYFEELLEQVHHLPGSDVAYGDGVLTIKLGTEFGTYVINRQTPNRQIWLSSPTSGPKRYDFIGPHTAAHGKWIYKHTNESLHELLQKELPAILKQNVDFLQLPYGS